MAKRRDTPSTPGAAAGASSTPDRLVGHVAKRRPIPRKGHTKSRAGCLVCKRRKVKCDEAAPDCWTCQRLGLACRYPGSAAPAATANSPADAAVVPVHKPLRNELATFTVTDLKFFQHFLFAAYPTLPAGGWDVWQDVSQLAHQYDFLIHAMLGLGASHLGMLNNQAYMKEALNHRVKAIKLLNEFLNHGYKSQSDADAAFGAVLSLTFQSAYIPDGLPDFLSMIRGCFVVGINTIDQKSGSRFKNLRRDIYIGKVNDLLHASSSDAALDVAVVNGFVTSLKCLETLCESPVDLDHLARMQRVAVFAATDPVRAYLENSHLYSNLGFLTKEDFAKFIDPDRPISRLIIMHLLCLDFVMSRKEVEDDDKQRVENPAMGNWNYRQNMSAQWIEDMQEALPMKYKAFGQWVTDLVQGFSYSFEGHNETWRPFLMHRCKATMRNNRALENPQHAFDCFAEPLPGLYILSLEEDNNLALAHRPSTSETQAIV